MGRPRAEGLNSPGEPSRGSVSGVSAGTFCGMCTQRGPGPHSKGRVPRRENPSGALVCPSWKPNPYHTI